MNRLTQRPSRLKATTLTSLCFGGLFSMCLSAEPAKIAVCKTCHGDKGAAPIMPMYPKLNGQNEAYLLNALKAYKADQRTGGMAGVMAAQAKMLSDAEMTELANYYSQQP